jgi:hypothetical protein
MPAVRTYTDAGSVSRHVEALHLKRKEIVARWPGPAYDSEAMHRQHLIWMVAEMMSYWAATSPFYSLVQLTLPSPKELSAKVIATAEELFMYLQISARFAPIWL